MHPSHEATPSAQVAFQFLEGCSAGQAEAVLQCFDVALLRRRLYAAGLCRLEADDEETLRAYDAQDEAKLISPNLLFDEGFYRATYSDAADYAQNLATSGLRHFVLHGISESRWPNEALALVASAYGDPDTKLTALDAESYLRLNASARMFLSAFPVLTPLEHYNLYGRFLHLTTTPAALAVEPAPPPFVALMEAEFDPEFYASEYLNGSAKLADRVDPFRHYLTVGIERQYSPNASFQEDWYRAYYSDVRNAIPREILCGFQHYILVGRTEGRMPRFDLTASLEAQLPGVTSPALISRARGLRHRLFAGNSLRAYRVQDAGNEPPTCWFLLPTLNPDIAFGGYRACFELIRGLRSAGARVAIYCTEDSRANKTYFLWREQSERIRAAFEDIDVLGREQDDRIAIGPRDRIVAYTVLDLYLARRLAEWTDFDRPYLLAQEYEPIFFDNSSAKALSHETYSVPHYPIVNSEQLLDYLRANRIGIFSRARDVREFEDYAVFEHRINQLPHQSAASMRARRRRVLAVYARPEPHAARNLFEIVLIALQNLCERGVFSDDWSFVGLGALSDLAPLALGRGHRLVLTMRTSEDDYRDLLQSLDIGVSMMYGPHPGLVALEFATTGAVVVTNVYENRTAADLRALSENIVPCEASLADLERAIVDAVALCEDFEHRERNLYRPILRSWDEIFAPDYIERVFRIHAKTP